MKTFLTFFICGLIFSSCSQTKDGDIVYRITEKDLIPEGITYASTTNSFYISSIHKTKIIQVDAKTGLFKDFIPSDLVERRFLGMITNDHQNQLWACGNIRKDGKVYSSISKFNLKTGELLKSYSYPDTVANLYNDLTQDKAGNIYFTNSDGQRIYTINQQTDSVSIFFDSDEISYPNGICISPDNKYLYIASTNKGIRVLDIEKREIIGEADTSFHSGGIDGLKYYKQSLIGIQNVVKARSNVKITQYFLDDSGTKITKLKIIDQNNPHFDIPTTFVITSDKLFCLANSQMANLSPENEIRSVEALDDIYILKYKLK